MYQFYTNKLGVPKRLCHKIGLIMRLTTVILIASLLQVSAAGFAQKITMSKTRAPLKEIIKQLREQSGYDFVYPEDLLEISKPVNIHVKDAELTQVLDEVFHDQPLNYTIKVRTIIVQKKEPSFLAKVKEALGIPILINGRVTDSTGMALPGASIKIKDKVTKTDSEGKFSVSAEVGTLVTISFVGYKSFSFSIAEGLGFQDVVLKAEEGKLQEVIVNTGYQTLPKERATGSFEVISAKKLDEQVGANILQRLKGVSSLLFDSHGTTDQSPFTIRGINTIKGNTAPLIVVDNFPYDGDINTINPDNVASITILKDAAASSIWGARAGNGVVVITTKKGNFNQNMKVSLTAGFTASDKPNLFAQQLLSPSDYIDIEKTNFQNGYYDYYEQYVLRPYLTPVVEALIAARDGKITPVAADAILNSYRNHDVRSDLMSLARTPFNQNYSLNINGGSSNMSYFLSAGYNKDINTANGSNNRVTMNAGNTYQIVKNLSLITTIAFSQTSLKSGDRLTVNDNRYAPYTRLIDANGNALPAGGYRETWIDTVGHGKLLDWHRYPATDPANSKSTDNITNFTAGVQLQYRFLKDFKADLNYQMQKQTGENRIVSDQNSFAVRDVINTYTVIDPITQDVTYNYPLGGQLSTSRSKLNSNNLRGQLNFEHTWNKHNLNVLAGAELHSSVSELGAAAQTFYGYTADPLSYAAVNPDTYYPTQFGYSYNPFPSARPTINPTYTSHAISTYANASYTYDGKYTFSISGRRDALNVFGVDINNKWKPLWSAGLSWNLDKEPFFHLDALPVLKLRTTYGVAGNTPTDPATTVIAYQGPHRLTGIPFSRVVNFANPDMKWEEVRSLNFAVDFGTKNGRISGSIEYYKKVDKGLFGPSLDDPTLGLSSNAPLKNIASMKAHGFDVNLKSINLNGPLNWTTNLILATNITKVTDYYNPLLYNYSFAGPGTYINPIIGQPLYSVITYKSAGLDPQTGEPIFFQGGKPSQDYNSLFFNPDVNDLSFNGSATPTVFGSLSNSFSWKGFSLGFNLSYKLGYYFIKPSVVYGSIVIGAIEAGSADFSKRWQKPGDEKNTDVPVFNYPGNSSAGFFYGTSEVLVRKGDHVRLDYLNIGYTLTRQLIPRLPVQQLTLTFNAANLGILWRANKDGLDPEAYDKLPVPRIYSLTLHTNF